MTNDLLFPGTDEELGGVAVRAARLGCMGLEWFGLDDIRWGWSRGKRGWKEEREEKRC